MRLANQILVAVVAVLLLAAAGYIQEHSLWSRIGNLTMPWFLSAIAVALLLLLAVCSIRGEAPLDVPWYVIAGTVAVVGGVLFVGAEIDESAYHLGGLDGTRMEVLGFTVLLAGLLLVAKRLPPRPRS